MIQKLVRREVRDLIPYSLHLQESSQLVILDGNESPYPIPQEIQNEVLKRLVHLNLNRYPDPLYLGLREKISEYLGQGIRPEQILVGNGSDEVLHFLIQTFLEPGDRVLGLTPTFSMYKVFCQLNGGIYGGVHLTDAGDLDLEQFWIGVRALVPKMIFLCSPNNPTGTVLSEQVIAEIAAGFAGILVIDEAYAEFSQQSVLSLLEQHPNLVITRTFSKALGLAGVRLGYLVANLPVVEEVSKVVHPFNLNSITQVIGEVVLDNYKLIENRIQEIISERQRLHSVLQSCGKWRVLPSEANFLYIRGLEVIQLLQTLDRAGIRVRRFAPPFSDAIRITIGTPEENDQVIAIVEQFKERWQRNGTEM